MSLEEKKGDARGFREGIRKMGRKAREGSE